MLEETDASKIDLPTVAKHDTPLMEAKQEPEVIQEEDEEEAMNDCPFDLATQEPDQKLDDAKPDSCTIEEDH